MAEAPTSRMFGDPGDLEPFWGAWDELAVEESQPFAAPAWTMAWWEHHRPKHARLRIVLVWKGGRLVGAVPLFSSARRYRPLGQGHSAAEPLARRGFERDVAEQTALRLAGSRPAAAVIELDLHASSTRWQELLAEAWPGGRRARSWVKHETPVPRVDLSSGFEAWMSEKSGSFRRESRRKQRAIQSAGGHFRYTTIKTLEDDLQAFLRLHRGRLAHQGGTSLAGDAVMRMLTAAGSCLLESGRFRLLCLDVDGSTVGAQVLVAAGREVIAWNSGFDERFSQLSPSMQCLFHAIADAAERGELSLSLGPGAQDYKYRLASEEDSLVSHALLMPGSGYPLARMRLASTQLGRVLKERLPAGARQRLRGMARPLRAVTSRLGGG